MHRFIALLSPFAVLPALLAGCDADGAPCNASAPGDLTLDLTLPDTALDSAPEVWVYDSAGANVGTLANGETLSGLPGGSYRYELARGWTALADGLRTAVGATDATEGSVCVGGEPAELTLDAADQPGSGRLWASSWENLLVLPADAAAASADPVATPTVSMTNNFNAITADALGNAWVATPWTYGARLLVLRPGALGATGEAAPALSLTSDALAGDANITAVVFDADQNLWITTAPQMGGFVGIAGWSHDALLTAKLTGGEVTADPTWAATVPDVDGLYGATAGADGTLWASADGGVLVQIDRTAVMASGGTIAAPASTEPLTRVHLWDTDHAFDWVGLESLAAGPDGSVYALATTAGAILNVSEADLSRSGDVELEGLQLGVEALPEELASSPAGGTWWVDTATVGYLPAPGEAATEVDVAALERPAAAWLDVWP